MRRGAEELCPPPKVTVELASHGGEAHKVLYPALYKVPKYFQSAIFGAFKVLSALSESHKALSKKAPKYFQRAIFSAFKVLSVTNFDHDI